MNRRPLVVITIALSALLLVTGAVWGAALYDFGASWHTLSSGGGQAAGGGYTLRSSIGQPLTGEIGDGSIRLLAGFPSAFAAALPHPTPAYRLYLPVNMR